MPLLLPGQCFLHLVMLGRLVHLCVSAAIATVSHFYQAFHFPCMCRNTVSRRKIELKLLQCLDSLGYLSVWFRCILQNTQIHYGLQTSRAKCHGSLAIPSIKLLSFKWLNYHCSFPGTKIADYNSIFMLETSRANQHDPWNAFIYFLSFVKLNYQSFTIIFVERMLFTI